MPQPFPAANQIEPAPAPRWGTAALLVGLALRLLVSGRVHPLVNPALMIFFAGLLLCRRPGRGRGSWMPKTLELGLLGFLGAAALSIPLGLLPRAGWDEMIILLGHFFMVLAMIRWLAPAGARTAAGVMVVAGLLSTGVALRQYFGGFADTLQIARPTDPYLIQTLLERRVFGLTFSPDMFAGFLAMLIPLALALALELRARIPSLSNWRMALVLLSVALPGFTLILSRSLGGCLAAGAGLSIFLILALREMPSGFRWISPALLILLLAAGLAWIGATRSRSIVNFQDPANPVRLRLENWRVGLEVAREKPLSGVGLGNFGLAYMAHRYPSGNEVQDAHNNYLQVFAETGPVGLLGFIGLALIFLAQGFRQSRPAGAWLARGILAGGAAFLAHSAIDFDLYVPEVAGAWWALLGLQAVLLARPDPGPDRFSRFNRAALAGLIICAMAGAGWTIFSLRRAEAAGKAMAAGNYPEAVSAWNRAVSLDPRNDALQANLALARWRSPDPEMKTQGKIIQGYRLAQALNPRSPFHHRDLAEYYRSRKQLSQAETEYRQAVALYPNSYELNLGWGRVLSEEKKWSEAEAALRHALECSGFKSAAVQTLAEVMIATGRAGEFDSFLMDQVRKSPGRIQSWQAAAWFRMKQGQGEKAGEVYREMVKRWPERAEGYSGLALVANRRNDRNQAQLYAQIAIRLNPADRIARDILRKETEKTINRP